MSLPCLHLQSLEATIIERRVRLLILDSAACLARADFAPGSLAERQRMLGQQVWAGPAVWFCCVSLRGSWCP
jgi:hypothetical protein